MKLNKVYELNICFEKYQARGCSTSREEPRRSQKGCDQRGPFIACRQDCIISYLF